jgi:hypothetical protein
MLPSEYPQIASCPALKHAFEKQVDMLFIDLRCMLKAPMAGCVSGFNLSIATIQLNLLSGFSRRLYRPSGSPNDNDRFKNMLIEFFPWENPQLCPEDGADLLYSSLRNPLTHELGIKGKEKVVVSKNGRSTDASIDELENSENKPSWLSCPVSHVNLYHDYFEWHVSVTSLYWAIHRLLNNLLADETHRSKSEQRMKKLLKM